ncbi:transporter substrate-binding domain-containing protein [Vibrio sp. S4M6]|nr:HD domain-containing phosphohydrolase [Vibrio sinus]MCL9783369.1 transporter substrate-binding domain-containing protein [Vibrio sinus]
MVSMNDNSKKFSIRITIGTLCLLVTILTAVVALSIHYYFISSTLKSNQLDEFADLASDISHDIQSLDNRMGSTVTMLSNILTTKPMDTDRWLPILVATLEASPMIYSAYIGTQHDEFYQLINLDSSVNLRQKVNAKPSDRWVVVHISEKDGVRTKTTQFLNEQLAVRDSYTQSSRFYPTQRPWFQTARSTGGVFKTEPYLFQHLAVSGQTYSAQTIDNTAVVGVDILLSTLSKTLRDRVDTASSEAFLFRESGEVLADTRVNQPSISLPQLSPLPLSEVEKQTITDARVLKISNQRSWAPMDYTVLGEPKGYAIDVLHMISQLTGIQWKFVNGFDWSELVKQYEEGSIDALHSLQKHDDGYVKGEFSQPIFTLPFGVLVSDNNSKIRSLTDLEGQRVAILAGWSVIPKLKKQYPKMKLVEVPDIFDGLQRLKNGDVKAFIDSREILQHAVQHYFSTGMTVLQDVEPFNHSFISQFHIVVSPKHAALIPIVNKAIQYIDQHHVGLLQDKWMKDSTSSFQNVVPYAIFYELISHPKQQGKLVATTIRGTDSYVYVQPVHVGALKEYLAITLPAKALHQKVIQQITSATLISTLFIIPMLCVAWFAGAPIARAIRTLRAETDKIKNRDYDNVQPVPSRVMEIADLSKAIVRTSDQLKQNEEQQEALFDSIVQLIAQAIDDKSPYTAGHCNRVPIIGLMLAEAAEDTQTGPFKDFRFEGEKAKREFSLAAWLHDCGKLTVPEYIVDKGTKLEANYNRIHEIRTRFEVLWRDAELECYRHIENGQDREQAKSWLAAQQLRLQEEFAFIAALNIGDKPVSDADKDKLQTIGQQPWTPHFDDNLGLSPVEQLRKPTSESVHTLLRDLPEHLIPRYHPPCYDFGIKMKAPEYLANLGEVYNLLIPRGTLTAEDRYRINEHMISGIKMLESLPFPEELKNVPRLATTHHETLAGTGYPRQLSAKDLSIPERILAIADIFEALTASDRPYKKAFPLSKAIQIMHDMADREHIDKALFELFLQRKLHLKYAQEYLNPDQCDLS